MAHDFETPEGRYRAIEALGPKRYNEEIRAHHKRSVIKTVAGHDLRPVSSRFGRLIMVGSTGTAFQTLEQAEAHALANPVKVETLATLTEEYQAELTKRGLPQESADELLHHDLSEADRRYVSDFYERWNAVENKIADLRRDARKLDTGMDPALVRELHAKADELEAIPVKEDAE